MRIFPAIGMSVAIAGALVLNRPNIASDQAAAKRPLRLGLRSIPIAYVKSTCASKARYKFAFRNETGRPFRYMQGGTPKTSASLDLLLFKDGKFVLSVGTKEPLLFVKALVRTLKPNDTLEAEFILGNYLQLKPGRYEIRAKYNVARTHYAVKEFGLTPLSFERTVMILHIEESLPNTLAKLTQLRIKRVTEKSHHFLGVDVGLAPAWDGKSTLFFVVRQSENGKASLKLTPKRLFRLVRVNPKARIETMVYNPFPESEDNIIEVHVLVTEPNKTQRYFLIDLSSAVILKKNKTLKPGTLYKLHKTKLGNVELLPRVKP